MKEVKSIKAKKLPLLWTQAIRQAEMRGHNFLNIVLAPLFAYKFSFKNHDAFALDHLIVGANPILTYCLLLKLHKQTQQTQKKPLKIGILFTEENDYWAYHILEQAQTFENIKVWHNTFQKTLENTPPLFQKDYPHELFLINNDNLSVANCLYDSYADGYVIHLKDKIKHIDNYEKEMPTVIMTENKLRTKYLQQFVDFLSTQHNKYNAKIFQLGFPEIKQKTHDNHLASHILCAKKVWVTSQISDWFSVQASTNSEVIYENQICYETKFNSLLSDYCVGSAKHIANDFPTLEKQTLADINKFIEAL